MDILHFIYLFILQLDGCLGGFTLTVMDNDPVNIFMYKFLCLHMFTFLSCLPRTGIAG